MGIVMRNIPYHSCYKRLPAIEVSINWLNQNLRFNSIGSD
jgi:hypothetical protein